MQIFKRIKGKSTSMVFVLEINGKIWDKEPKKVIRKLITKELKELKKRMYDELEKRDDGE